jgi:hypothetical protein
MYKLKILIVSRYFYPSITPRAFRATELAREFARQGSFVKVITSFQPGINYGDLENNLNVKIKNLGKEKYTKICLRGNKISNIIERTIKRTLSILFEFPDIQFMWLTVKALSDESDYDLLISIAVHHTIHWGVARSRTPTHKIAKTWVADCGDPYMGEKTDSFRKIFYFKYIEQWFCRKADFITVPVEAAKNAYYPEFRAKIRVIPQGFRIDELNLPVYRNNGSIPKFAYAGGFIKGKRDPRPFLKYLSGFTGKFKFIVYTTQPDFFTRFKTLMKNNLEIREYIQRDELLKILATMDFLINFDNNVNTQSPSKLIDYALTTRPVLNIKYTRDFSLINDLLKGDYRHRMKLESPAQYDIKVIAENFLSLIRPSYKIE